MEHTGPTLLAALTSSLASGPIFLFFLTCVSLYEESVHGISVDANLLAIVPLMLLFSVPIGFVLSAVPN